MDRYGSKLGAPDLSLAGFQLWVHRPRGGGGGTPDWLNVTVHCGAQGASVWVSGEIVETDDLAGWLREAGALHRDLSGVARLAPLEPNLAVVLKADSLGHLRMRVEITPDHLTQRHRFEFDIDQSYLPPFLAQGRRLMARLTSGEAPARP